VDVGRRLNVGEGRMSIGLCNRGENSRTRRRRERKMKTNSGIKGMGSRREGGDVICREIGVFAHAGARWWFRRSHPQ
jgi:hypothetical protein